MSEFLIRVQDKTNSEDIYLDVKCLKRGDVVVVCPDEWKWSEKELSAPYWRIVKVPGLSIQEANTFLVPELGDRDTNRMLRRRAFKLDVDNPNLPAALSNWINDSTRAQPSITLRSVDIQNLKVLKTPLSDPNTLG